MGRYVKRFRPTLEALNEKNKSSIDCLKMLEFLYAQFPAFHYYRF